MKNNKFFKFLQQAQISSCQNKTQCVMISLLLHFVKKVIYK